VLEDERGIPEIVASLDFSRSQHSPQSCLSRLHALVVLLFSEAWLPVRSMQIVLVFHEDLVNRLRCLRWLLRIKSTGLGNERDTAQGEDVRLPMGRSCIMILRTSLANTVTYEVRVAGHYPM